MKNLRFTAILFAFLLILALPVLAQEAEALGDSEFDWSSLLNTVLVPALVLALGALIKVYRHKYWMQIALEIITKAIEEHEPAGNDQPKPIKSTIKNTALKKDALSPVDNIVNQAKSSP